MWKRGRKRGGERREERGKEREREEEREGKGEKEGEVKYSVMTSWRAILIKGDGVQKRPIIGGKETYHRGKTDLTAGNCN